jgi:hypothetical protein
MDKGYLDFPPTKTSFIGLQMRIGLQMYKWSWPDVLSHRVKPERMSTGQPQRGPTWSGLLQKLRQGCGASGLFGRRKH